MPTSKATIDKLFNRADKLGIFMGMDSDAIGAMITNVTKSRDMLGAVATREFIIARSPGPLVKHAALIWLGMLEGSYVNKKR